MLKQPKVVTDQKSQYLAEGRQTKGPDRETDQVPKKPTDEECLDRAYASANSLYRDARGMLHVAGTRRGVGSDCMESYEI